MPATLLLRDGQAEFVPGDGVVVLQGHVDKAGKVDASVSRPGGDANRFTQVFEGEVKDGRVTGRYGSPRCRADVTLARR